MSTYRQDHFVFFSPQIDSTGFFVTNYGTRRTILVLVVGAPAYHVGHVLRFLVDRHGFEDGARRRLFAHQNFHRRGLSQLAVQLVEHPRILTKKKIRQDFIFFFT